MSYDFDKTHELIMRSALKNFREHGFRNASIRNICKDAGVTNGAFYAHFNSKDDLFSALVSDKLQVFNETYQDLSEMHIKSSADVLKTLELSYGSIETLIRYIYSESDVFRLILESSGGTSYENFVSDLIEAECTNTMAFLDKSRKFTRRPENISFRLIKIGSSMVINCAFDAFLNGVSEEDNIKETKLACDFCIAGYKELLGM
ncbi:MAG: TetR/AcrR family transcriptional regulator [Saccharofermentans sp.]|nr:TetR/AcrR family transcriptional regulator [Saccharofermentans sp.]